MDGAFVPAVVPGATTTELAAALEELNLIGSVIDGSELGIEGVAVARILGDHEGLLLVAEVESPLSASEVFVLEHLGARWSGTLLGDEAEESYELWWPVMTVGQIRTVAVTPPAELMLSTFARVAELTLHEAPVGDRLLVGISDGDDWPADVLVDALVNAKGRSLVMWSTDTHAALHVMKRGKHAEAHLWEPKWQPFGHPDFDELRDPGVMGDAAAFGRLLGLDAAEIVSLRALFRQPSANLPAVAELLGLPHEAVDVLEGRTTVADLPSASTPEPRTLRQELAHASRASEHDPAWFRWTDAGARELKPWYVVSSLLTLVLGAVLVADWISGGSTFWGMAGLVLALGTLIDLPIRWWSKRRRP